MDILNELRTLITLVAFVTFIGSYSGAWSGRRKAAFTEAPRIPLDDDDVPGVQTESGVERSAK